MPEDVSSAEGSTSAMKGDTFSIECTQLEGDIVKLNRCEKYGQHKRHAVATLSRSHSIIQAHSGDFSEFCSSHNHQLLLETGF